eukprot:GSChrysophyteH2.ASY1.ANO1.1573.1 assembled CDS
MAVAAIVAMRHHEEQLKLIHKGEQEEEVEGNDDIYERHQKAKKDEQEKLSKNMLAGFLAACGCRRTKVVPEDPNATMSQKARGRSKEDDATTQMEDDEEADRLLDPENWPSVPRIFSCYLRAAIVAKSIADSSLFNNGVTLTIVAAGLNVGIQTYPGMDENTVLMLLDWVILFIFTVELIIKFMMEGYRPYRFFIGREWAWNNFDTTIVLLSYPVWGLEGGGSIALLRLVRLARLGKLIKKIPALNMIITGLAGGLSSITYIMILLFLVFYLYGVVGFYTFAVNDPFHFGTLPLAMMTLFRCATLENWGDIMFLNIYGCDVYPDMYVAPEDETSENVILWCRYPSTNWTVGPVYFVSFIVIAALVMLSLFIGAVTISMTESMVELKTMNAKAKALAAVEHNMKRMQAMALRKADEEKKREKARKMRLRQLERDRRNAIGDDLGSLDGSVASGRNSPSMSHHDNQQVGDADHSDDDDSLIDKPDDPTTKKGLRKMKLKYPLFSWYYQKNQDLDESELKHAEAMDAKHAEAKSGITGALLRFAQWNDSIASSGWFQTIMTLTILVASFNVGIQTDDRVIRHQSAVDTLDLMDVVILYIFTLEVVMKIFAEGFHPWKYFYDNWNVFDFFIVAGSYVPGAGSSVTMLRLLRLLRVLKLVKRLPQLAVIINALLNGMVSIAYVGLVLILFFYVFAIIGMLIFQSNDPWHFGSLHMALFSLFQAATLDDWTILMYVSQYGCDKFAGVFEDFPEQCTDPKAHGLIAVFYFLTFILVGAQVLLSLFIGVISTSMDEAQEAQGIEQELDEKIRKTAKKLLLDEERVNAMINVFNKLDLDGGGSISEEELKIGLDAIDANMSEEQIIRILQKVSPDGGGVDANGFILFMYETPMFGKTSAISKISNAFGANQGINKPLIKVKKGMIMQFLTDIFVYGGTTNRIYWDQLEAALVIQDVWIERQAAKAAKRKQKMEMGTYGDAASEAERRAEIEASLR